MTEKTLTTENIKPALDALRGELAPWPVVAKKQDRLNDTQTSAVNSGITSSLVAQIIANTAAIRALESAITGTGLRPLVVASLPAIGTQGILYIVPVTTYDPETDADVVNYSNEYIWIVAPDAPVTEGYYEQVGQTGIVINNGQLTIKANNVSVGTFTANQAGNTDVNITVPTNADYVDLSTSQTVTGGKTWTGEQSFTLPIVGSITGTASKAIADEDGTSIKTGYVNVAGNQTVSGNKTWTGSNAFNNILPNATNTYSLGSSSYQWSSVYAQTYYYNGTAWGLDKANTWSQNQSVTNAVTPKFILQDTRNDRTYSASTTLSSGFMRWECIDKDGAPLSRISTTLRDDKVVQLQLAIFNEDSTGTEFDRTIRFAVGNTGSAVYYPEQTGNVDLGDSSHKWKTLNGINPGALSLPKNSNSASYNIDTTNWTTNGSVILYTPLLDGWLYINARNDDTNGDSFIIFDDSVSSFGTSVFGNKGLANSGVGLLCLMMPVNKNNGVNIRIKSPRIVSARLYPCQGNV